MITLIKYLVLPSNLLTLILLISLLLTLFKRYTLARTGFISAFIIYFVFASGPISHLLLSSLEYRHAAFSKENQSETIKYIIVLTGDAEKKPQIPISSYPNSSSAYRLLEAQRLFHIYPEARIIITGYDEVPGLLKDLLVSTGIPENAVVLDNKALNTFESASNVKSIIEDKPSVLITSAGHMPRALKVFQTQGLSPVPAPTEFLSQANIFAAQYTPTSRHMMYSDLAIHEYIALAWYQLTGKISD